VRVFNVQACGSSRAHDAGDGMPLAAGSGDTDALVSLDGFTGSPGWVGARAAAPGSQAPVAPRRSEAPSAAERSGFVTPVPGGSQRPSADCRADRPNLVVVVADGMATGAGVY